MRKPHAQLIWFIITALLIMAISYKASNYSSAKVKTIAYRLCETSNANRRSSRVKDAVLREFLVTAAQARDRTAANARNPEERQINIAASVRYRQLVKLIKPAKLDKCVKP